MKIEFILIDCLNDIGDCKTYTINYIITFQKHLLEKSHVMFQLIVDNVD